MWVAFYPTDGKTTDRNVVYRIDDLRHPVAEKYMTVPGQYDGIAFSSDGQALCVTNWVPSGLSRIGLATKQSTAADLLPDRP